MMQHRRLRAEHEYFSLSRAPAHPNEGTEISELWRAASADRRETLLSSFISRGFTPAETPTDVLLSSWSSSLLLQARGDAGTRKKHAQLQLSTTKQSGTHKTCNVWLLIQNQRYRRMTKLLFSINMNLIHTSAYSDVMHSWHATDITPAYDSAN